MLCDIKSEESIFQIAFYGKPFSHKTERGFISQTTSCPYISAVCSASKEAKVDFALLLVTLTDWCNVTGRENDAFFMSIVERGKTQMQRNAARPSVAEMLTGQLSEEVNFSNKKQQAVG